MSHTVPPSTRKEMQSLVVRAIKKASAMSANELFGTLVRAGVYTKHGNCGTPANAEASQCIQRISPRADSRGRNHSRSR